MKYNTFKNASGVLNDSCYLVKNPKEYKNKWSSLFGNNNKICLELGMGRASFIIGMAKRYPNINFIGIELDINQTAHALNTLRSTNLKNVKIINSDAREITEFFGKEIDTIYLTFSEPWPKRIDRKKRFTDESYLKLYDRVFKKNKHIILKTDNKILFSSALESLSNYWYVFKKVSLDLHNDERNIDNVMTDFEKEYFKQKRQIYYLDAEFNS